MKYFYSKLKFCLTGFFMIGLFLLAGEKANSQTTLSPGDILFTGFDATFSPSNGDVFTFVLLKDITSGTVISFTDRGYFGGSSWQSVSTISSESDITWTSGSALSLGTQIYIKGLTASVFDPSGGTYTPNGTVALTNGTSSNGLNLSAIGDEIIAYQGGGGSVTGSGVTIIAGINYYYCVGGSNSTAGWNSGSCADNPNSSEMPPGLTGGFDAYFTGPISGTDAPDAGYFSCTGGSLSTASEIRTAVMNTANWTLSATTVTLPNTCTFGGPTCALTASISSQTNIACNGGSTGSLTVTASGGAANYKYTWSNGSTTTNTSSTTNTISALSAGTYSVTIEDANGCTATANATITQPTTPLTVGINSQTNVSCNGGSNGAASVTVNGGTGSYTYNWTPGNPTGDGTPSATGLPAGTWTCTVTDANGCTASQSITITESTAISLTPSSQTNIACFGGATGAASVNAATGGNGGYTYNWTPGNPTGDGTTSVTGLTAGTWTCTVTDGNSCTASYNFTITQPTAALSVSQASQTNIACKDGATGAASVTVNGGTGSYTYNWTPGNPTGDGTASATGLTAGTWTCTVTDSNNCTASVNFTVTEPTTVLSASATATDVTCNGGDNGAVDLTVTGGDAPYTYAWSNSAVTEDMTDLEAGTYSVTVTDANGCTTTASATVDEPAVLSASTTFTAVSCYGGTDGSIDLTVTGGTAPYTFAWSNSAVTEDITNLAAGTYDVTVTDANGCTATASRTVFEPMELTANAVVDSNQTCGNTDGAATASAIGGSGSYTYLWSNGATTASISGVNAGTYSVTITDTNGCNDSASVTITSSGVVASAVVDANVSCNGGSNGAATATATGGTPPYTYSWDNGATTASIADVAAGTYTVTITDNNSCSDTATVTITEPSVLATSTTSTAVSCNGGSDGTAHINITGGTSPYQISWSSGDTTADRIGLSVGEHDYTITDANGCTVLGYATVTQPEELSASTTFTAVSCYGGTNGTVNLTVTGGTAPYTYAWSNSAVTEDITNLAAGTYNVTVTDANGCTATASATVTEPTELVASAVVDSNISCNGNSDGEATASATGGTGAYTYLWSNGATTASITGVPAGTYNVTITDANGCTDTAMVTVNEPTALEIPSYGPSIVYEETFNSNQTYCPGTSNYDNWGVFRSNIVSGATYASITISGSSLPGGITCNDPVAVTQIAQALHTGTNLSITIDGRVWNVNSNSCYTGCAQEEDAVELNVDNFSCSCSGGATIRPCIGNTNWGGLGGNTCGSGTQTMKVELVKSAVDITNVSCNGGNNGTITLNTSNMTSGVGPYTYTWSPGNPTGQGTNSISGLSAGSYDLTVTDANGCTDSQTYTITEPAILSASGVATNVNCNGGSNGTVDLTVTGGTAPYTYVWSNSATTEDLTAVVAGTYDVTVTDANGCTATASATVTEPTVLAASAVTTEVSCNGGNNGAVDLTITGGTAPYTYIWSNTATTEDLTGLEAGTYDVTVTDANGCTATASATVNEPAVLTASAIATNVNCNGGTNGTVDLTVTGGTAPYTFVWSNTATTEDLTGLSAGTYDVTVTDANGCTTTASATVTEPTVLTASAIATNVNCNGGTNGTVDLTVTGGTAPYTYVWNNSAVTEDITDLAAGAYDVTVTDANGCTATASATVTEPTILSASAITTAVSCNGGTNGTVDLTVTGGTAPYTYAWSNTATTEDMTGLEAGTYDVTVTDANGCTATASATVTEPAVLTASLSSQTNILCNGESTGSASITVTGGNSPYTYLWSNGATTATINNLAAGTYDVTVTDSKGCTALSSVEITEPTLLIAAASVDSNVTCNTGTDGGATASATGGSGSYTYLWSSGATTASIAGVPAGIYIVTVTDANGCTDTASVTITEPTEIVVTTSVLSQPNCNGDTSAGATASATGGTGPYSYYWNVNGYNVYTAGWVGSTAGTYTVTVTDANGCTATGEITITEPDAIDPGVTQTNVSCFGGNDGQATATPTGGVGPFTYSWSNGATTASISDLVAGTYIVTITDANGCTATDTVTITEPTELVASAVVDANISCNGNSDGEATASATGGTGTYTYLWSNGTTTASIAGVPAGTYNVTITDANGCTDTAMVTITEPAVLTASVVTTNVSCNGGSDGAADLTVTGGTAPYTYVWSNAATTEDITGLVAGTYNITVTDANGCTATASITVTEPAALMASAVTTNVSCNAGSNGMVDLTVTGGTAPYTFVWSNTETTEDLTGLTAGTYDVTVTDANGCTATASATVTEPTVLTASAVTTNVSCNGGNNGTADLTVTGGTAPYTFVWSNAATTEDLTGLAAGTYDVTVTDANGCTATASATVTEPTALAVTFTTDNVSCPGGNDGTATVTVTGGITPYTYIWSNTGTTASLTGLTDGTYTVTVTDANGCVITDSVVVNTTPDITAPVADVATLTDIVNYCGVMSDEIPVPTATDNCAGLLIATTTDPLDYTEVGTYVITWTYDDGNGNTTTQTQNITVEESPLNAVTFDNGTFTYDGTVHTIEVNNLPAGATVSYSTSPDTGSDNGAVNAGTYTVTANVDPQPEAFNCESIVLTATITIDQAPQTITFDALPVKNLEADPDFQLDATASSGLEVYYTYTYTSPDPAADVTSEGWVDMLTSGEITITAHQDGNENYLPAATVSQVLVIESSDASIFNMNVGDVTYDTPPSEIYHLIDCGDDSDSVEVTIVTEVGATVNPGHTFTIQTPQPGIYSYVVTVTSQDGTSVETYTIVVERRFDFSDIVVQKFDNVLLVNNNSQNNGGYEFTDYEWYKNGVLVGTGQYFSEGNNQSDTLDPTAEYMVKVTTIDGDVLQTCLGQIQLQHASGARLYPNPVTYGQLVTVEADFPESELENMTIAVYNLNGALITEVQSSSRITQLQLPLQAATYIVVLKTPNNSKTFKVLVQ